MHKKQIALDALQKQQVRLKDREKRLKADLDTFMAKESKKLRLALGGFMLEHLTEPAIRRVLCKALPTLRPNLRDKLSAQLDVLALPVPPTAANAEPSKAAGACQLSLQSQDLPEAPETNEPIIPAA